MIRTLYDTKATEDTIRIGPQDHGRAMTSRLWNRRLEAPGYTFEIIDGALVVSPNPLPRHDYWVQVIAHELHRYAKRRPSVINWVTERCDVVIPGRAGETRPQPDIAAFHDYPNPPPKRWDEVRPIVVVEVVSDRRSQKDVIRNRHLYWQAKGIGEYWVLDPTRSFREPRLIAHIRADGASVWQEKIVEYGKPYRSTALPKLTLNLDTAIKTK